MVKKFEHQLRDFRYTFYCQSLVTSVAFAKFHPNLIMGGCYSGQICMWDNRLSKKTPVNKVFSSLFFQKKVKSDNSKVVHRKESLLFFLKVSQIDALT